MPRERRERRGWPGLDAVQLLNCEANGVNDGPDPVILGLSSLCTGLGDTNSSSDSSTSEHVGDLFASSN